LHHKREREREREREDKYITSTTQQINKIITANK